MFSLNGRAMCLWRWRVRYTERTPGYDGEGNETSEEAQRVEIAHSGPELEIITGRLQGLAYVAEEIDQGGAEWMEGLEFDDYAAAEAFYTANRGAYSSREEYEAGLSGEGVRAERDTRLAKSDISQLADQQGKMTPEERLAWTAYRQALRDVPEQEGFPGAVEWPEVPGGGESDAES